MTKKLRYYPIMDDIYRSHISLYVGDYKEFNKLIIKWGYEKSIDLATSHQCGKFIADDERAIKIIWIKNKNKKSDLMHELIHFCFSTFKTRGIPITEEIDEVFAYYYQYMWNKISNKLK